ncbi:hypothetical protein C7C45_27980 [Micromonospora arborensis]|uniref:NadR/Ttd14 AAA domain-containing protein n=1 Tax=Micromonospora arborensis TaxID=2116518 RepID=A0A318NC18_9ACTN|nr:AAA family ATPase [Micromonospora arborensis]PYC65716.1 hypothetical protein C7C45_27980 [Micromonospora arborensis]
MTEPRRYVLTGAPGAGKTTLIEALSRRGHLVIREAATDIIATRQAEGCAEPWQEPDFVDAIARLRRQRRLAADAHGGAQIHDRSPLCTLALARHLGRDVGPDLAAEIDRITSAGTYQPLVFLSPRWASSDARPHDAYATFYPPDGVSFVDQERAVVDELAAYTSEQPWWLGYLKTGAHDVVFPRAPRVSLYGDWSYVLVEAGPEQALTWRTGHSRGDGPLPDLLFPADRSWLVSALWDDTWTDIGGSAALVAALHRNPLINARRVGPDDDALPPGLTRE